MKKFLSEMTADEKQRRYAILEAAAIIFSGSFVTPIDKDSHPEPYYWESFESSVSAAIQLMNIIDTVEL